MPPLPPPAQKSLPYKPSLSRPAYDLLTVGIPPSSLLLSAHEALVLLQIDIDKVKDEIFEAEQELASQGRASRIIGHRLLGKEARDRLAIANEKEKRMRELEKRVENLRKERGELRGDIEWFEQAVARDEGETETAEDMMPQGLKIKAEK